MADAIARHDRGARRGDLGMNAIAAKKREESTERERRIGRAPKQIDPRKTEDRSEEGREFAERIKCHDEGRDGENRGAACKQSASRQTQDKSQKRQRAKIDVAHVAGEHEVDRPPQWRARRPPIICGRSARAVEIGGQCGEKGGGMQRAARRAREIDGRPVGLRRQRDGERERHGAHAETRDAARRRAGRARRRSGRAPSGLGEKPPSDISDEHERAEKAI